MCTAIRVERGDVPGSFNKAVLQAVRVGHCTLHQVGELSDAETDLAFDGEAVDSGCSSNADSGSLSESDSGYSCDDEAEYSDTPRWRRLVGNCTERTPMVFKRVLPSISAKQLLRHSDELASTSSKDSLGDVENFSEKESDIPADLRISDRLASHDSETDVDVNKWQGIGCRLSSLLAMSDDEADAEAIFLLDVGMPHAFASHLTEAHDVQVDNWRSIGIRISSLLDFSDDLHQK